ncbi:hypothetical protein [Nocardia terpenica]|uniref:Uncharacterized protein n=1 Tax=Nocardia terpenica TaxID=455432 RepID=A0A6G9ZBV6_9NOCA|nr:hypothetical protein [Nocardia terpenica]QIS22910.1 hypothetical protein F6W96_35805 [Nocardia terpenica]
MVGVLIRMRWRITLRALSGGGAAVAFALGTMFGVLVAVATAAGMAAAGHAWDLPSAINVAATLYAVWTMGWLFGPILAGSSDETLQPEHFRLLPLSHRQLAIGLLAVSCSGPAAVVNLIAFGGVIALAAQLGVAATIVAIVGTVGQVAFVILLSRVLLAWIGAAMRSRRGRDLGVLLAALVGLSYYPLQLLITYMAPRLQHASRPLELALRIVPSGWVPYAVEAAARGQWWWSIAALAGLAVLSVLLWQAWAVLLRRRLTVPAAGGTAVRVQGAGRLERLVPATPLGAVVVKELRTWWRDSRRRAALLPLLLIGILLPAVLVLQKTGGAAPFAALFVVTLAVMASANMYGFDGTAIWHTLLIPGAIRVDVRGRMLAWAVVVGTPALLLALIMPGATGHAALYPWVVSLLPGMLGVGACAAILLSAYTAYPLPPQRGNPFASGNNNPGCARLLVQAVVTVTQLLVNLPVVAILGIGHYLHNPLIEWCALPTGIALGIAATALAARLAEKRVDAHGPELLAEVRPR